jgi:hypothetical protein
MAQNIVLKSIPRQFSLMMGRGAMAAHQTLNLWILVRFRAPQPEPFHDRYRVTSQFSFSPGFTLMNSAMKLFFSGIPREKK